MRTNNCAKCCVECYHENYEICMICDKDCMLDEYLDCQECEHHDKNKRVEVR